MASATTNLFLGYEYERDEGFASALPGLLAISATNLAGAAYDANARASWARFLSDTHAEKIGTPATRSSSTACRLP